jgi:MFS family permease
VSRSALGSERGARRWLVVGSLFLTTYGQSTMLAAYGVFLPFLVSTFGWSRGAISAALSINLLVGGVAGLAFGWLADRYGPRLILGLTGALAGGAYALVSSLDELWQLYLVVGVLGGIGTSSFYVLSATTIARWFDARRGIALALVLVGFNLGYITAGPLVARLIERIGWHAAFAAIGAACAVLTMLAGFTVRLPRPGEGPSRARTEPRVTGGREVGEEEMTLTGALADRRQWYLNVAWSLQGGLALMLSVHVVPFGLDQGLSLATASLGLTAYGLGSAVGRIGGGAVSDRFGARQTIGVCYALEAIGLVGLVVATSPAGRFASLMAVGAGFAASDTMFLRAVPDVFGMRAIAAIMGVLTLGWRWGAALGPMAAGFAYDLTGSYALVFSAAPGAAIASWILFALGTAKRRTFP